MIAIAPHPNTVNYQLVAPEAVEHFVDTHLDTIVQDTEGSIANALDTQHIKQCSGAIMVSFLDRPIGFCLLETKDTSPAVGAGYLLPQYREHGIGKHMYQLAIKQLLSGVEQGILSGPVHLELFTKLGRERLGSLLKSYSEEEVRVRDIADYQSFRF